MIIRSDALEYLASIRTDEVVITAMKVSHEWPAFSNDAKLDFPMEGAMGQAPSVGLGIALAQPNRKVWVFNGDGCQLMNLGSFATIANSDAKNLVLFIFENGTYETTGGQPIPLAGRLDFTQVAKGLQVPNAYSFDDLGSLEVQLPAILKEEGPAVVVLKVVPGHARRSQRTHPVDEMRKLRERLAADI